MGTFVLSPQGSDFVATSPMNLVASDDEWAAPIMAEVGPDGCVWIIDWYNFIVQHNPTPEGFRTGKGNAYESDLRDKKHGRIYRLVYAQPTSLEDQAPLSSQDPAQLVSALRRPNLLWRRHAQRLLVERQQRDVVPALLKLVSDPTTDALGLNVGAIHALWTLQGLGVITPEEEAVWNTVTAALNHPSAGVRRNAIMVLPAVPESAACLLSSKVLHDTQPQVRLAAFLAMADLPEHRDLAKQVAENLLSHAVMADRWLGDALTSAAAMQGAAVWQELSSRLTQGVELPSRTVDVLKLIAGHIARSRPQSDLLSATIAAAAQHPVLLNLCMQGLSAAWPRDHRVELSADAQQQLLQVFEKSPDTALQGAVLQLSQELGLRGLEAYVEQLQQRLLAVLADPQQTSAARIQSARDLVRLHPRSESVVEALLQHITPQTPQDLAVGLIDALRDSQADRLGSLLLGQLPRLTPAVRQAALRLMLSRPVTTRTLLAAIRERQIPLDDLSLDQKQALATHPDRNIRQLAAELLSAQGGLPDPDRQKVLDAWRHVAERQGDATLGKEVFKKQCAKCHTHSGEGTRIGPDLTGMSVHPKHELLVHILDPSRSVEGNFRVYTVALNDGRVLSGMLASETRTAIELIDTEAKRHPISRDDIDELVASPKSLMPEGFEKQLTPDDMTHLLEFLTTRGKYFPLDLRKVATATSTKGMFVFEEADHERLIFPDWSPKTVDGIPFQLVDPQGDRVPNVVLLYSPNGTLPTRMPRRVSLPCNSPAKALHFLSGVAGWGHPFGEPGSVSMIVRLHYADGSTEDHELKNGIHFADYIRVVDVPGSKLAFRLRGQQIRYFAIQPQHTKPINTVELIKGPDATAPVVMAITVETP
ncbi:MAG: hypothetical protein KatS3mg113_1007 [Planctomycetaceae bacterium]|nr:MAG: hypothetical protein KatS3mg113_1007 [Planctomycetaceae bacterium]